MVRLCLTGKNHSSLLFLEASRLPDRVHESSVKRKFTEGQALPDRYKSLLLFGQAPPDKKSKNIYLQFTHHPPKFIIRCTHQVQ